MQRVLIIGSPGSGKSLLAQRLGAATGLPVVHLDSEYWSAGWREPSPEAWEARLTDLLATPRWIMDGNYAGTLPQRLARADAVILLECPVWLCLVRVLRRAVVSFGYRRGQDMAEGCPERLDWAFLVYIWRFSHDQRPRVDRALQTFPGRVARLRGKRAVTGFLRTLRTDNAVLALILAATSAATWAAPARAETAAAGSTGLVPPVSPACVSSPFGPRVLPGKPKAGTYHYGIDLPAPAGAPVRAVAGGEVITIHKRGAGGLEVALRHTNFTTLYSHLGSVTPALAEGRRQVAAGETLGVVGRTGVSYGTHVYFELRVNGERVDPAPYLGVKRCG